ncbi:MAG TPA: DoxX family protein [Blastocatellia bacterium]|nr:DoxX family protein [Blastocatellia bacterium]
MASRIVATTATWAPLPIRIGLGLVMFAHGAQKVLGIWGGRGFNSWIEGIAPMDLRPSWFWLGAAAFSEFIGGALVLLGLFTRVAAFFIACVMAVAIAGVHWRNGFFLSAGGFEYAFTLLCMAISLIISGGGNLSVDQRMA